MTNFFKGFLRDESGASAAEYALILAVVGLGILGAATALSGSISTAMGRATTVLNTAGTDTGGDTGDI